MALPVKKMFLKLLLSCLIYAIPYKTIGQQVYTIDSAAILPVEEFAKPKPFRFITNVPGDISQIFQSPFQKKNLKWFLITAGATFAILPFDQRISDGIKHLSGQMHFHSETDYKVPIRFGKTKILRIPQNLNSAFYQLGEGGTSMIIAGGLFIYGKIGHDKKAIYTASDLTETFITMGITTQLLKRISGRESPFTATKPGGAWRPFPSFSEFQQNTSNYDAFPSGHLATMMATVSTLRFNYPNKKWIGPVGYGLTTLTGLAMINTDVHWMSDYPLALALGYISAKITYLKNHPKKPREPASFNLASLQ